MTDNESFNIMLTNNIVSFEQLSPAFYKNDIIHVLYIQNMNKCVYKYMHVFFFLFLSCIEVLVFAISITSLYGIPVPTSQYKYDVTLDNDGKYKVYWDFNETHIIFEVHVQTKGYVGFGISPNGAMWL